MIKKHYIFTALDAAMMDKVGKQQKSRFTDKDFNYQTVVFKPWGFEYLFMKNKECCGWMLHIITGSGTSVHCHAKKKTIVMVISGNLLLTTIYDRQFYKPGEIVLIDEKVFHAMGAPLGNVRVIELEYPSDKTDAIRGVDFWSRKGKPYESKCKVIKNV